MSPIFSPSHKKVIFFDMNNTLVDRRQCFDVAFIETLHDYTARWESEEEQRSSQDALQSYKQEWSKHRKEGTRNSLSPEELRQACLKKALQPYPITVSLTFSKAFFDRVETQEEQHVSLFPGVEETLSYLAERYKLAIISNSKRSKLVNNVKRLKLTQWIDEKWLYSSHGEGSRKPNPAIYEAALKGLNVAPEHCIMVGNSWKNDIVGSTKCGMDAIWIHPPYIKKVSQRRLGKQKVVIVRNFKQLLHLL
jgi:HAD superfamily hydrolase (TIGR01662 family)